MEKETLEESLPSLFFSHTLISISLPTFCLSGRPTYQQLGDLQVRLNAIVGRREMATSDVEVSAKEKKKSKKERDKRSEVRTNSDKDKEALEWAIKKSQKKEERKREGQGKRQGR